MSQSIDRYIAAWIWIGAVIIAILYFQHPACIGGHDYAVTMETYFPGSCIAQSTWALLEFCKWTMIILALFLGVKCCIDHIPPQEDIAK